MIVCVVWRALAGKRYDHRMVLRARNPLPRFMAQLVAVALLAVWASRVDAADEPTAALDDIYREQDIQPQLSIDPPPDIDLPSPRWEIPPVFAWIVLVIAAVGAVALAVWMGAFDLGPIGGRRRRRQAMNDSAEVSTDPEAPVPADWLRAADGQARQGQFGEAIHLLLLGILGTIPTAEGQASKAKTAREIARAHVGADQDRLRSLVDVCELVHFGGRAATRQQFEDCRLDAVRFHGTASPASA